MILSHLKNRKKQTEKNLAIKESPMLKPPKSLAKRQVSNFIISVLFDAVLSCKKYSFENQ